MATNKPKSKDEGLTEALAAVRDHLLPGRNARIAPSTLLAWETKAAALEGKPIPEPPERPTKPSREELQEAADEILAEREKQEAHEEGAEGEAAEESTEEAASA